MALPDIAVVIPRCQRKPGLLSAAVRSAFAQTAQERLVVIACDDESPISAADDLAALNDIPRDRLVVKL